jgi:hypothetical protein
MSHPRGGKGNYFSQSIPLGKSMNTLVMVPLLSFPQLANRFPQDREKQRMVPP